MHDLLFRNAMLYDGEGSPGKRGDLTVLAVEHPDELCLAVGQNVISDVVIGGRVEHSTRTTNSTPT